ncbi:MAG: TerC family protein [Bradyrhizobiaceae bacterium]|nr:TerC family protein [Bradyrhizobiaceae bacterium]
MLEAISQWAATEFTPDFWLKLLQIVWIDILLAGDNAVVIAMACRALPPKTRRWGIVLGALVAVLLRILFAGIITTLLNVWGLKVAGGLALIYIAVELLQPQKGDGESSIQASESLFRAVRTVAIADLVMSLDNVIAIAGVARGDIVLLALGLAISIPLVIGGATLITAMLDRFPVLVQAGAALLGWIAGEMIVSDAAVVNWIGEDLARQIYYPAAVVGAAIVLTIGAILKRRHAHAAKAAQAESDTLEASSTNPNTKPEIEEPAEKTRVQ